MTPQEQLIQLHELSQQEAALYQQLQDLHQQQNNLAKTLYSHLTQEEWVRVTDEVIAYVKHSDYLKGDTVDRNCISFSKLYQLSAKA